LLVEPNNSEQIADAVERLIMDGALRRKIIEAGYRSAETQTAEYQARRLATLIAESLSGADVSQWACDISRNGPPVGEK
jgi:glycosyltransferase involved in cell wall biosynthesis